jgi:GTP pyrophosphokinase
VRFDSVQGRIKRLYSLWRKMKKRKISIEQVYDLIAIRLITPNEVHQCYAALGVIHNTWHPVPGRIKDWIAMPRDNLYQSLHTSVISEIGQPFEVQIRTEEMHQIAEEGVAAHWKYKGNKLGKQDDDESWNSLRSLIEKLLLPLVESTQEAKDSEEFIESLKLDLYPKDVYAFTPMGKVIQLPKGATPLDFAYAIHSQVGHTCSGAKINGRIVPLRSQIQNGDVVEILTNPNAHPSRDWLNYIITSRARNRVRHWISEQQRVESIEQGRRMLEKEAERYQITPKKLFDENGDLKRVANEYGLSRMDDLLAAIGYGKIVSRNVIAKYLGQEKFDALDPEKKNTTLRNGVRSFKKMVGWSDDTIIVKGVDDLLITRARCCNPLRGEQIIGYISLGKGIVVHTKRCKNVTSLLANKERIVEVEWASSNNDKESFAVKLLAITENRTGMIAGITGAIADIKTGIRNASAIVSNDDRGHIEITVEVFDVKHLDKVISSVKSVAGVLDVERLNDA